MQSLINWCSVDVPFTKIDNGTSLHGGLLGSIDSHGKHLSGFRQNTS